NKRRQLQQWQTIEVGDFDGDIHWSGGRVCYRESASNRTWLSERNTSCYFRVSMKGRRCGDVRHRRFIDSHSVLHERKDARRRGCHSRVRNDAEGAAPDRIGRSFEKKLLRRTRRDSISERRSAADRLNRSGDCLIRWI